MKKVMVEYDLNFRGVSQVEQVFLYGATYVDDNTRQRYLERAYNLGRKF